MAKKYIVLDTETTGLEVKQGHRVIEIGAVLLNDRKKSEDHFHSYLNPSRLIDEEASKVHGITNQDLEDKPSFDEIAEEFINFIEGATLVIHNAPFDLGFLDGELGLIQKDRINKKLVIDSLEVARNKFPGTSNSLDALCKKFNIDLSRRTKHNALLDCELLREVYINLLDVKEPKFNLSNDILEQNVSRSKDYNKAVVKISDNEIKKHKEFLKSELKKNFY